MRTADGSFKEIFLHYIKGEISRRKLTVSYTHLDYEIPSDTTGECWAISGHANGMSHVAGGRFDGKTLGELWNCLLYTSWKEPKPWCVHRGVVDCIRYSNQ